MAGDEITVAEVQGLETRMRAVEVALASQTTAFQLLSRQWDREDGKRKDTCPHLAVFSEIRAALEAGGKRFAVMEAAMFGGDDDSPGLAKRVGDLESRLANQTAWLKGAKWSVILGAGITGWLLKAAAPYVQKALGF